MVDVGATVDEYLEQRDSRVDANANQGYSLGGLILNVSGHGVANYWLSHVYPPEIGAAHREGAVHIHDLDMLAGYCAGWSLRQFLHEGLNGVPGKVEAGPPKHLSSAVGQIVNFLGTLQNEWAGAQAFCSFDTYIAPFVRNDGLSFEEVEAVRPGAHLQPERAVALGDADTGFTNLTFNWPRARPTWRAGGHRRRRAAVRVRRVPARDGHDQPRVRRDHVRGGRERPPVHLPHPDLQHHARSSSWDNPNLRAALEMTAKYGIPYFPNFINSDLKPNMTCAACAAGCASTTAPSPSAAAVCSAPPR